MFGRQVKCPVIQRIWDCLSNFRAFFLGKKKYKLYYRDHGQQRSYYFGGGGDNCGGPRHPVHAEGHHGGPHQWGGRRLAE